MRHRAIWTLVAGVLVVAGVLGGLTLYRRTTYGTKYGELEQNVAVSDGAVFTTVVPDRGESVGDSWAASVSDDAIISEVRSSLVASSLLDRLFGPNPGGGGGQRLITFRAKASGKATVTLRNCFQGCDSDRTRAESRSVSWNVTVAH